MHSLDFAPVTSAESIQITANLAREIWHEHFPIIIGVKQVNYMLQTLQSESAIALQIQEGMYYYLIQTLDHPIGYLAVKPESETQSLFLSKLYLLQKCRGQGLGHQAIAFVEALALEMGLASITLTCNKNNHAALQVYHHLGFTTIDSMVKDIGQGFVMDDYILEKSVKNEG